MHLVKRMIVFLKFKFADVWFVPFILVIYNISEDFDLDFFALYSCTGLWNSFFILIYSTFGLSQIMKWSTRQVVKTGLNTFVTPWRLGVRDILELPLLAASSKMETAPIAGKTWQPSHEPPRPRGKQAPVTLIHSGKQRVGREGTKTAKRSTHNAPTSCNTDK